MATEKQIAAYRRNALKSAVPGPPAANPSAASTAAAMACVPPPKSSPKPHPFSGAVSQLDRFSLRQARYQRAFLRACQQFRRWSQD